MSSFIIANKLKASNLPPEWGAGECDPYILIKYEGVLCIERKTEYVNNKKDHTWTEELKFDLKGAHIDGASKIKIEVWDHNYTRHSLVGTASIPCTELIKQNKISRTLSLTASDGSVAVGADKQKCEVGLCLTYQAPIKKVSVGQSGSKTTDGAGYEEGEDEQAGVGGGWGGKTGGKSNRTRKVRAQLSTQAQDFQVRIKVVEGRRLDGGDIDPLCRVTCLGNNEETQAKTSTSQPVWNEIFFFTTNMSPADIVREQISFGVYNSLRFRFDSLIGRFQCDLGEAYDMPDHTILNKWLLLSDKETSSSGVRGYVKVCVSVLGPGDKAPSFQATDTADDIESNLLMPAGAVLHPASFTINIYGAEDLPRMDTGACQDFKMMFGFEGKKAKERTDPYVIASFAGKRKKTRVEHGTSEPEWNQEIKIGFNLPSVADKIEFQIYDEDDFMDEIIATHFLHLDQLGMSESKGFLPMFGPAYVNFYGSNREFSLLWDDYKDLNYGKGEGVGYRGRVLLEVKAKLEKEEYDPFSLEDILRFGKCEATKTDISVTGTEKVQKYMGSRRQYALHVVMLEATLMEDSSVPIEFEVSIGAYGNKFDDTVEPCASTSHPANTTYDGCHHHYLPWETEKPYIAIDSSWEDVTFRMEGVNVILRIVRNLEIKLKKLRTGINDDLDESILLTICKKLLKKLDKNCNRKLPVIADPKLANRLDRRLWKRREEDLASIRRDVQYLLENLPNPNSATHKAWSSPSIGSSKFETRSISSHTSDMYRDDSKPPTVKSVLKEATNFLGVLKQLAKDPQASIPDVFIWMLKGTTRAAYYRIPANEIFYSPNKFSGVNCAKLQSIVFKYLGEDPTKKFGIIPGIPPRTAIPGMLRMKMWFGCKKDEKHWVAESKKLGKSVVTAETYENHAWSIIDKWGPSSLTRPCWSDIQGNMELTKNKLDTTKPSDWEWKDKWAVNPENSLLSTPEQRSFTESIYEINERVRGGRWNECEKWINGKNDPVNVVSKDKITPPTGWTWIDKQWEYDTNRGDHDGWEYSEKSDIYGGGWNSVEKTFHLYKRRRCYRLRSFVGGANARQRNTNPGKDYGWEYATWFDSEFHSEKLYSDFARRRRWHRRMGGPAGSSAGCVFGAQADDGSKGGSKAVKGAAPKMFLEPEESSKRMFQLRAYIYQARDLPAADSDSLSDPYAVVSFSNKSDRTEVMDDSLCPKWDQTLILNDLTVFGDRNELVKNPPQVCIDIFDQDMISSDFLGRCFVTPFVKLSPGKWGDQQLVWHNVTIPHLNKPAGELLASFELIEVSGDRNLRLHPKKSPGNKRGLYEVPPEIRPKVTTMAVEALLWGVRAMQSYHYQVIDSPFIKMEIGGKPIVTDIIKDSKKNPNFNNPVKIVSASLPVEPYFMPPITMLVMDDRIFGPTNVGTCVIKDLTKFMCLKDRVSPIAKETTVTKETPGATHSKADTATVEKKDTATEKSTKPSADNDDDDDDDDEDRDWWTKYNSSKNKSVIDNPADCHDTLQFYTHSLEKVKAYQGFTDFCDTFEIMSGMDDDENVPIVIGQLKASFQLYPIRPDNTDPVVTKFTSLPSPDPVECIVRLYCIRANDLQPMDPNGLADPYVWIKVGNHSDDSRDNYLPRTLSPVFGKMFEFKVFLPLEKDLKITIMDYDPLTPDDTIGQTIVDLENRFLTQYRGTCGLPMSYCSSGPDKWRDAETPKQILARYCEKESLGTLTFSETEPYSLKIGERSYKLEDFARGLPKNKHWGLPDERLALHVLHTYVLVKEHVETRPLTNPVQPGFTQGNLEMWVDIFPTSIGPPGIPVNVTPRKPKKYILRCVIYNTVDVILDEQSITGEWMSDIYVNGWVPGGDKQSTDVHYRSMDGEGNFNWRFVFPFDYDQGDRVVVSKSKASIWCPIELESRAKPELTIQIFENDIFSPDDYLGELILDLHKMVEPAKTSKTCDVSMVEESVSVEQKGKDQEKDEKEKKKPNCFRGFWPFSKSVKTGQTDEKEMNKKKKRKTNRRVSLFKQKKFKGFWPCSKLVNNKRVPTGKVEMEIELLDEKEAEERPAAVARDEPNMNPTLQPPKRPDTSFSWFSSPLKSCKFIVWKHNKCKIIGLLLFLVFLLLGALTVYTVPGAAWSATLSAVISGAYDTVNKAADEVLNK